MKSVQLVEQLWLNFWSQKDGFAISPAWKGGNIVNILRFNVAKQAGNKINWIADTDVSVTLCPKATADC